MYQEVKKQNIKLCNQLILYPFETNKILSSTLYELMDSNPRLKGYEIWFNAIRSWNDYMLFEAEEKILLDKSLTSTSALISLYGQSIIKLKFKIAQNDETPNVALEQLDS